MSSYDLISSQSRQHNLRQYLKMDKADYSSDSGSSEMSVDYYHEMSDVCGVIIEKYGGRADCCHVCAILPTKSPQCRQCGFG